MEGPWIDSPNSEGGGVDEGRDLHAYFDRRGAPALLIRGPDGRLRSYIESQGDWELVRRFTDQLSGATLERPGLRRAISEARANRFDLLLVYWVDRLARSVRWLAQILEDLDHAGVAFRSATEPFDTGSPAGRMMVQMLGVFAEFERATIIDRVISATRTLLHSSPIDLD